MKILVTGSFGLVGSAAAKHYLEQGHEVLGIDNNSRAKWFGCDEGDIIHHKNYRHAKIDIQEISPTYFQWKPDAIIHCAGQPSHDKSAEIPVEDFSVNALATVKILELTRTHCPETAFIFLSTNKVYGDNPNRLSMKETETRYELINSSGIDESMSIDAALHSPFGVSKAAADLMVQEYGKYYGLKTVAFRCGCITGPSQRGVSLHGFLNYLCRCAVKKIPYVIYGHRGKQVRDTIHVDDLVAAFDCFLQAPTCGDVYNIGGGAKSACSIKEIIEWLWCDGYKVEWKYDEPRKGDHICYYTNYSKFQSKYPNWSIKKDIVKTIEELCKAQS